MFIFKFQVLHLLLQELMEEDLQRELARNEAATRLAMEREIESRNARQR